MSKVILKEGREKSLLKRHPWIFSGAIEKLPEIEAGEVLSVYSSKGDFLAKAYFHPTNSLAGRVLTFQDEAIEQALEKNLKKAIRLRETFIDKNKTNAYRLVNAEADLMPGLIVDFYNGIVVIQITTSGMEVLRKFIVKLLVKLLNPVSIYEKSLSSSREQEGLEPREGLLYGDEVDECEILENGMKFVVSIKDGQKTGFFLDQRERRLEIERFAKGRKVLNCYSYSGGFSLFALRGGAKFVDSVDSCKVACELARKNTALNHLSNHKVHSEDVSKFLDRSIIDHDLIILDPPAFAKKRADVNNACTAYKAINRKVMEKAEPGTLILTCSCSYYVDEKLFQTLLFQCAEEAKRDVKIISRHLQALDHPISLFHPEGEYLKSFLLYVSA